MAHNKGPSPEHVFWGMASARTVRVCWPTEINQGGEETLAELVMR